MHGGALQQTSDCLRCILPVKKLLLNTPNCKMEARTAVVSSA